MAFKHMAFTWCALYLVLSVGGFVETTELENALLNQVSYLTKKVELLEEYIVKENIEHITGDNAKGSFNHHRLKGDNRFGFTASLTHSLAISPTKFIPFNKVTSNLGNTYNNGSGIYTCALTGNYFLSATVTASHDTSVHAVIVVDGVQVASVYAKTDTTGTFSQGSNSAVAHCNAGQQIAVKVIDGNSVYGSMTSPLTSFTGYLIWDD